jgi:hypothetical protein
MMEMKNIINLKINISRNLMHIRIRKGTQNPSLDASESKGEKGRKGEKCTYCHKEFHLESHACKKK